jgi:hypothetical protein
MIACRSAVALESDNDEAVVAARATRSDRNAGELLVAGRELEDGVPPGIEILPKTAPALDFNFGNGFSGWRWATRTWSITTPCGTIRCSRFWPAS